MNQLIPQPSEILRQVAEIEYRNSITWDALQMFKVELTKLVPGTPDHIERTDILLDSFFKLSITMTNMIIFKAQNGIIGNSWYKG